MPPLLLARLTPRPAEAVAHRARQFGHEDDIPVLALTLAPAEVPHA